ncbi:DUF3291 domain-containing protein [Nocardiopsis sp. MG754419]|uniref:DUF3291 domain-containing protein n=1 Tax=Nocardiopsis sp. MG754419 TaxID=2259865 RepID=UPI001BA69B67|nr:DUF3291 domain-containing protein [Nocardiopsis sp. MG754419]MBR8740685.1 hypothetical protein [Nocardiopsis sp. MG754419]
MRTLLRSRHAGRSHQRHHSAQHGVPHTSDRRPALAEALVIRGDRARLTALARALRSRAEDHSGHLGEVHFHHEGDRLHLVHLWRGPTALRAFVEEAHADLLAYRRSTGDFPTVERALWWSTVGGEVTEHEATTRLAFLREHGPGPRAFTLASPVPVGRGTHAA